MVVWEDGGDRGRAVRKFDLCIQTFHVTSIFSSFKLTVALLQSRESQRPTAVYQIPDCTEAQAAFETQAPVATVALRKLEASPATGGLLIGRFTHRKASGEYSTLA